MSNVPFAGKVTGVTVSDIDSGKHGLVEYNTPEGVYRGNRDTQADGTYHAAL